MAYKEKADAIKYNNKFIADRYDRINLTVPKGRKAELQAIAERHGQSVNGFINSLIDEAMERERAGAAPADGVPAGSPAVEDGPGVVVVSAGASPDENSSSRSISLESSPKSVQPQVSIYKQLADLPEEERLRRMGCDLESAERYRERMERKRQRLEELNAKAGGLSRAENAERQMLLAQCRNDAPGGDSPAQE